MKQSDISFDEFYDDALAYLKESIKKKIEPSQILSTLIHDIAGVARQEACFLPRVSGWAKAKKAIKDEIK